MKRILAALLLLTLAAPAWGQDFEKGSEAYVQGDYATALREFRPLAEQGHVAAQFKLGVMYGNGQGVPQDDAEAVKWYRKAANQGHAEAIWHLGNAYLLGFGLPIDYQEAVTWWRQGAEKGDPYSQRDLGSMYEDGDGVPQNFVLAHVWYNLAASKLAPSDARTAVTKLRDELASKMTPAQIAEAQRLAREWMAAFEKRKKN